MYEYLLLITTCFLTCAGQLCQKRAADRWRLLSSQGAAVKNRLNAALTWMLPACLLLGLAMLAWLGALRGLPVSVAYPMLSLNFVLTTMAAQFIFKEKTSARHWSGVAVISLGIILVGLSQ